MKKLSLTTLVTLAILASIAVQSRAENIDFLGKIYHSWRSYNCSWSGNLVCVAAGEAGCQVIDASDLSNPRLAGYFDYTGAKMVTSVCIEGQYAYLIKNGIALILIDLHDPMNPEQISSLRIESHIFDFYARDSLIYLATGTGLVTVLRNEQNQLQQLDFFENWVPEDAEIVVDGSMAVISNHAWLAFFDIADPANLDTIAIFNPHVSKVSLAMSNGRLFVASGEDGIWMFNVVDPRRPFEIGHIFSEFCEEITVEGNRIYFVDDSLYAYDVTQPELPVKLGAFDLSHHARSLAVHNSVVMVEDISAGLHFIDYSDSLAPRELSSIMSIGEINDVKVQENFAYVAADYSGLRIVDIADPTDPVEVGSCELVSETDRIELVGNRAILGGFSTLYNIDVTDPTRPTEIGDYFTRFSDFVCRDSLIILAHESFGLKVLYWSILPDPVVLATVRAAAGATVVAVNDTLVYLADESGLRIFDITNPRFVRQVGAVAIAADRWGHNWIDIGCSGSTLVLFGLSDVPYIFDISDPTSPRLVQQHQPLSIVNSFLLEGATLYLACGNDGILLADISNPMNPVLVGYYETEGYTERIAYSNGVILAADESNLGLYHYTADGVDSNASAIPPQDYQLAAPYPNPFNSTTLIRFDLPQPERVRLAVYDLSGREIALIADHQIEAGHHELTWDAANISSGLYLFRLDSPEFHSSRKLLLVR